VFITYVVQYRNMKYVIFISKIIISRDLSYTPFVAICGKVVRSQTIPTRPKLNFFLKLHWSYLSNCIHERTNIVTQRNNFSKQVK